LPATALQPGLNRLTLKFAHTAQPRQVLPANVAIGTTGVSTPVDLEVNSGSDFAFITVGIGPEAVDASAHRRGINVALIDPETGRVTARQGFDTAASEYEAEALARFIGDIPVGYIVIVVSRGLEAAHFFDDAIVIALQSIGLEPDMLAPPFSAIGVKGAAPGAALAATGEGTAYLRLGGNPDTRTLAAAVDEVVISSP
jgi:hypothetical protein